MNLGQGHSSQIRMMRASITICCNPAPRANLTHIGLSVSGADNKEYDSMLMSTPGFQPLAELLANSSS